MKLFNTIFNKISHSVDTSNSVSTSRVQTYMIIVPIIIMVFTFLIIEMWSFIHAIKVDKEYRLSNEIIVVFGMVLSHHLAILFNRTKSQSLKELKGGEETNDNTVTQDAVVEPTEEPKA